MNWDDVIGILGSEADRKQTTGGGEVGLGLASNASPLSRVSSGKAMAEARSIATLSADFTSNNNDVALIYNESGIQFRLVRPPNPPAPHSRNLRAFSDFACSG